MDPPYLRGRAMTSPSLGRRLRDRKIGQWALAYLAGAWALLEALAFGADRFGLPGALVQGTTVLAVVGFLATLVLAWYHGEKGRQRLCGPELALVIALLVAAGATVSALRGRAADAATEAIAMGSTCLLRKSATSAKRSLGNRKISL